MSDLYALWQSNVDLHERFGVNRTMPKAIRRVDEETREARDEAKAPDIDKTALAHEIVDVFYTWVGVAITAGLTVDDLMDAINIVNRKNAMKTKDTHYLDLHTGKITRLQKLPIKGGGGT